MSKTQKFTAIIEKCLCTNLYVGYGPRFPEAHSQGETLDELCLEMGKKPPVLRPAEVMTILEYR